MSIKTSYPLDEVDDIPDYDLPLAVQFKHTKVFDEDLNPDAIREAERQLTTIFQVHGGPVVKAKPLPQSAHRTGNIDCTFFHPGSLRRYIDNNAWSGLLNQRALKMGFKLTTDIAPRPDEIALWIGGCPNWNDDVEELKELIKECLNFDFDLDFLDDPLRREIVVVSPVEVKNVDFKMILHTMVRDALLHFGKNPIKWKRRKRLLLVKGASNLFVTKWKERLGNQQPLSNVERDLIHWTESLLEKRARDLGLVTIQREDSPAPVRPPRKRQPQRRIVQPTRDPHNMSEDDASEVVNSPKKKQQKVGEAPSTSSQAGSSTSFNDQSLPSTSNSVRHRIPEGWRGIGVKREFDEDCADVNSRDPYDQAGPSNAPMPGEMDSSPEDAAMLDDDGSQSDSIEWLDDAGNIIARQATSLSDGSSRERSNGSPINGEVKKAGRRKGKKKVLLPSYMDPEDAAERKLRYQQDEIVKKLLRKLEKERRERGEASVVITMTFNKNDDASLKRRVNRLYKSLHKRGDLVQEDERESTNGKAIRKKWGVKYEGKTIVGNHKKYIIEGLPFSTPRKADGSMSYDLVKVMDDSQGPLECYATRQPTVMVRDGNGAVDEGQRTKNPDPSYKFISTNEKEETPHAEHLRENANRCTVKCQCEGVCRIETCACMQQSVYQDGKIQEALITDAKWMVYECCADCHCQKRKEQCPSIVKYRKLKFHLVHFTNMGWALRVMEPVERGEPLVVFTGVYETEITEDNKDWAFTCADCDEEWMRKFCGIDDEDAYMLLSPQHKGNSAGRICHSKASNAEFMKFYRGGMSTFEPECLIYATEHLEAGELLWLDYGDAFWAESPDRECFCTQELCHDEKLNEWLRTLSKTQLFHVLKSREGRKRRRIQKSLLEAANDYDEGDGEIN